MLQWIFHFQKKKFLAFKKTFIWQQKEASLQK